MSDIDFQNGFINGFVSGSTNIEVDMVNRRDTEANWQLINPIIANGEQIIVDTTNGIKIKIGDGVSHFNDLEYVDKPITDILNQKADKSEIPTALPAAGGNADTVGGKTATEIENTSKAYADSVKNDLLNGAGPAYDTLKELGDLIDDNKDTLEALELVAIGKADKVHSHEISDVNGLSAKLNEKITSSNIKAAAGTNIASVGTPTVTASKSGNDVTFIFDYLKGATGAQGPKGDTGPQGATGPQGPAGVNATTTSVATTSANGLMSAADKKKLDGVAAGANAYTHPTTTGNKHIPSGGSSGQILRWSADGTATWSVDKTPIIDTRSTNQTPEWYWTNYPRQVVREFKSCSAIGLSGETYCYLETIVPWGDASGGFPKQIATTNNYQWIRVGISTTTWSTWAFVFNSQNDVGLAPGKAIDLYHESQGKIRAVDVTSVGNLRFGVGTHPTGGGDTVTELVGGAIHFWAKQSNEPLQPYYAAGDTFELNGITGAMIYINPTIIEFTIPLAKPIIGEPTISAAAKSGMLVKQEGRWLYGGSESSPFGASIKKIEVRKYDKESLYIVVHFNNTTNALANSVCAANYSFYITLS